MSIYIAGDVCLAEKLDFDISELMELIGESPLVFNLESCLFLTPPSKGDCYSDKKYNLYTTTSAFDELISKVNVVGVFLANNHLGDYKGGLDKTQAILESKKIKYCGYRNSKTFELNIPERKIVFYSFVSALTELNRQSIQKLNTLNQVKNTSDIREIRAQNPNALIIASPHWGYELQNTPQQADVKLADELISAGADLVIGHHPHVIQDSSNPRIVYSIGNSLLSAGPYHGRTLKYTTSEVNQTYLIEVLPSGEIKKHLFEIKNNRLFYKGPREQLIRQDIRHTPKGYPQFHDWNKVMSKIKLEFITIKRIARNLAIQVGIHKPYNW